MRTTLFVLAGLGLAAAAVYIVTTENGKKFRHNIADNLNNWRERWSKATDGVDKEAKHAEKKLRQA
jgi:hypothetical protein